MSHLTTSGGIAGNGAGNTQVLRDGARRTPAGCPTACNRASAALPQQLHIFGTAPVTRDAVMFS